MKWLSLQPTNFNGLLCKQNFFIKSEKISLFLINYERIFMTENKLILKALVGSRAHGLHTETSDYDYRGVYVIPTRDLFKLDFKYSGTSWLEGEIDDTSYEIGHFLQLCTKANPSALEVLMANQITTDSKYAETMRELFPYMYDPHDAFSAFTGYSKNQRTKLLDNHSNKRLKFAVAYIRTMYNLNDLFETGTFSLEVTCPKRKELLLDIKANRFSNGEIIDLAEEQIEKAASTLSGLENKKNLDMINDFLSDVRKDHF